MSQVPATATTSMTSNDLDHAPFSDSAWPRAGLASLPNEILLNILTLVMSNDTPVEIYYITSLRQKQMSEAKGRIKLEEMPSNPGGRLKRPSTALRRASGYALRPRKALDLGNTAATTKDAVEDYAADLSQSIQGLLIMLNPQSIAHVLDWLCVTQTCTRFRAWGVPAFFLQKTFVISPSTLVKLVEGQLDGFLPCFTSSYQKLALEHIRHVVAPVVGSAEVIRLPRYRVLPRLLTFDILLSAPEVHWQFSVPPGLVWSAPTAQFLGLLKKLGLTLDECAVRYAHELNKNDAGWTYRHEERFLNPLLREVLEFKGRSG